MTPRSTAAALVLLVVLASALARAQPDEPPAPASPTLGALEAIRDDVVHLRLESALAAIDSLLGEPALAEPERAEALVLRAQAHVALGDLAAAERDWREVLRLRPSYFPDSTLTPRKALERFEKVRDAVVGRLVIEIRPLEASVLVDGRPATASAEGIALATGEHEVRAEASGFDPALARIVVEPGQTASVALELVPNARDVVVLSEPEDVEVRVDGIALGRTARGRPLEPARLVLDDLPLGEHLFELARECFRTEQRREIIAVDLLERSPAELGPIALVPERATLAPRGGPPGARYSVDGEVADARGEETFETCPGARRIDVHLGERLVWREDVEVAADEVRQLEVTVRPNLVLVGEPPEAWSEPSGRFNVLRAAALEVGEPESAATWSRARLPPDADLAVTRAEDGRVWVFSPILREARPARAIPELPGPRAGGPAAAHWIGPWWGLALVDSRIGGAARVAEVTAGGPAAAAGLRPGDRVLAVDGQAIASAEEVRQKLAEQAPGDQLVLRWEPVGGGAPREGALRASATPLLLADPGDRLGPGDGGEVGLFLAAFARAAAAAADEPVRSAARANLALLLGAAGRHDEAIEAWRAVSWPEREGIGAGTVRYYLGRELEAAGREAEAAEAYRAAATSRATALDDDGPHLGPAARDRLADLGRTLSAP